LRLLQVDAFTDQPFRGNPAAVVLLDRERDAAWMQDVAAEMNLSETAFLLGRADGFSLRWFTPAIEVDLCGHATLASAHVLWEEALLPILATARFHTRSGVLTADRNADLIELNFPATEAAPAQAPAGLLEALGARAIFVGRNRFDYLVQLETEDEVRSLNPDHRTLKNVPARGIIVTARASGRDYDFVSRFFAPASGIDEDPVTGSSHCTLAPFWSERMQRTEFTAYQASPRGGFLRLRLDGGRVRLAGRAVTVLRGDLIV
jgi:PhzF family phenazine biosynthesis protein